MNQAKAVKPAGPPAALAGNAPPPVGPCRRAATERRALNAHILTGQNLVLKRPLHGLGCGAGNPPPAAAGEERCPITPAWFMFPKRLPCLRPKSSAIPSRTPKDSRRERTASHAGSRERYTKRNSASACLRAASVWPPSIRASSVTRAFRSSSRIAERVRPAFTSLVTT